MGFNDHIDFELYEDLTEVIDSGDLEGGTPEYGIAQKVRNDGVNGLSDKQKWIYDNKVLPLLVELCKEREGIRLQNIDSN